MHVITVNTGSSSVRLGAFQLTEGTALPLAREHLKVGLREPVSALRVFSRSAGVDDPDAVSHRVVHGGSRFVTPTLVDPVVERELDDLASLAPLHNPRAAAWIRAARGAFGPSVPQVAVFDTAFYSNLPDHAATYAIPHDLAQRFGIRRYGFHGLAHQSMWERWRALRPDVEGGGRVISLQLGAGASATAILRGRPQDTSMGFSPLEGLVMATRSGDVDPGVLTFLLRAGSMSPEELNDLLNHQSGLLGLSGLSADVRDLSESPDPAARLALRVYAHRARKYVGAYLAVLGGVDAILFGGGVGEHQPGVREDILAGLEWAGIILDSDRNRRTVGEEGRISAPESPGEVWVVPPDEERILVEKGGKLALKLQGAEAA